ncbi:glycosyltransferase family 39 protein [bacterium]|nr:glycosyltransferase family 39 protein [bacterium]
MAVQERFFTLRHASVVLAGIQQGIDIIDVGNTISTDFCPENPKLFKLTMQPTMDSSNTVTKHTEHWRNGSSLSFLHVIWLPLLLGLTLRLLAFAFIHPTLANDPLDYHQLGEQLAVGSGYVQVDQNTGETTPTAYRPIGYPAFIGLIYSLFGATPATVRIVQVFFSTLSIVLFALIVTRFAGKKYGKRGAWLGALYVPHILYPVALLSETVFLLLFWMLLVLSEYLRSALIDQKSPGQRLFSAATVGLFIGVGTLVKPILWGLGMLFVLLRTLPIHIKYRSRLIISIITASLLLPLGWMVRNQQVMGAFTMSTNTGANLWVGNNPDASGGYEWVDPAVDSPDSEIEADKSLRRLAVDSVLEHPVGLVKRIPLKIAHLFRSDGELLVDLFTHRKYDSYSEAYRAVPGVAIFLTWLSYSLVILLGWTGWFFVSNPKGASTKTMGSAGEGKNIHSTSDIASSENDRPIPSPSWYTTWRGISALLFVVYLIFITIFFGSSRFHEPLLPLFMISAVFIERSTFNLRSAHLGKTIIWGLGVLFFVGLWFGEFLTLFLK